MSEHDPSAYGVCSESDSSGYEMPGGGPRWNPTHAIIAAKQARLPMRRVGWTVRLLVLGKKTDSIGGARDDESGDVPRQKSKVSLARVVMPRIACLYVQVELRSLASKIQTIPTATFV